MTAKELAALAQLRDDAIRLLVRSLPLLSDEAIIALAASAVRTLRDERAEGSR